MSPDRGGVRDRGADHRGVDPLRNTRPRAPISPGGREEGIEEGFRLGRLRVHMFMPPEASVEGKAQVLRRQAVGYRSSRDGECPRRENPSAGKEDGLRLCRIKDKSTGRAPLHKAVHGLLDMTKDDLRVRAATEDGTVVSKGDAKG